MGKRTRERFYFHSSFVEGLGEDGDGGERDANNDWRVVTRMSACGWLKASSSSLCC